MNPWALVTLPGRTTLHIVDGFDWDRVSNVRRAKLLCRPRTTILSDDEPWHHDRLPEGWPVCNRCRNILRYRADWYASIHEELTNHDTEARTPSLAHNARIGQG